MTNEQLVRLIRSGDSAALDTLIEQNSGAIHYIAGRYNALAVRNRGADFDDLRQAAAIGIIQAVQAYDEARGDFITFAYYYMHTEISELLGVRSSKRRIENDAPPVSLHAPIGDGEHELCDVLIDETAPDMAEAAELDDMRRIVRAAVRELPERQRDAIVSKYFKRVKGCDRDAVRRGLELLSRNKKIKYLWAEYESAADCHVTLAKFNITFTSSVEQAAERRERILKMIAETKALRLIYPAARDKNLNKS